MDNYFVAPSYQTYERIGSPFYNKNGKLCIKVKDKCPRCGGAGIIVARVENEQLIPIPVDNGICYQCRGKKYIEKEVRLYTEAEYNAMQKNNERARIKREQEREEKMKSEYADKKNAWLEKNGFSAEGETYIITEDSYSIKDELKAAGWRYDPILKWHKADPTGYEDRVIKINVEDCFGFSAWGEGRYLPTAKQFIENLLEEAKPESTSEWVGEIGDKIKKLPATLVSIYGYNGHYGYSQIVKFQSAEGNIFTWFTATDIPIKIGETCLLTGTIKKFDEYKGEKTTIITRCRLS